MMPLVRNEEESYLLSESGGEMKYVYCNVLEFIGDVMCSLCIGCCLDDD